MGRLTGRSQGVLLDGDVQVLLRFMLYGVELYTAQGDPIRVSTHLLRHVTATVMREQAVPLEAITGHFITGQTRRCSPNNSA